MKMSLIFMFNEGLNKVLLIHKNHPEWQSGMYNGIGGKLTLEEAEKDDYEACIIREVKEETSVDLSKTPIIHIGHLADINGADVAIFAARLIPEVAVQVFSVTDEKVSWHHTMHLPRTMVGNLKFLVPYACCCLVPHNLDIKKTFLKLFYNYK